MVTPYQLAVRKFRIRFCLLALARAGGNVTLAAQETGIHRNTFTRMLKASGSPSPWQLRRNHRAWKAGAR